MKKTHRKCNNTPLDIKISHFLQQQYQKDKHQDIFMQSDDDQFLPNQTIKNDKISGLMPTLKIQTPDQQPHSEYRENQADEDMPSQLANDQKINQNQPILEAQKFQHVSEIDFELYTTFMARSRVYGALLIDQFGKILWCDKLSHQLLEGSLNKLDKKSIPSFWLHSVKHSFLRQLKSINHFDRRTIVHWIIYSKNTRRRYKKLPFPINPSSQEIFYRFLKALTVRIRPVAICLPNYRDKNGFCNQKLISKQENQNCFFLELRLSQKTPTFSNLNIKNDMIIQKYLADIHLTSPRQTEFEVKQEKRQMSFLQLAEENDDGQASDEKIVSHLPKQHKHKPKIAKDIIKMEQKTVRKNQRKKIIQK